jgi:hypothetical protein
MKNSIILCALLLFGGLRSQTKGTELAIARPKQLNYIPHIYADALPSLQEMVVNDSPEFAMTESLAVGSNLKESNSNRKNNFHKKLKSFPKI